MKLFKDYSVAKLLIILAGLSASFWLIAGETFQLVSEEEYRRQLGRKPAQSKEIISKAKAIFGPDLDAPLITINSPSLPSRLYSPIQIEIKFQAVGDASIQIDSLKVLYGWLNLDITDRIKQHADITYTGILAENVKLPIGEHTITIEITDTMQRTTEKEVSFEILEPGNSSKSLKL